MTKAARWSASALVALATFHWQQAACLGQDPKAILQALGGQVGCVAFSPDGKTLAAGCKDGRVELWEVLSHQRRATLRGHAGPVRILQYSEDGAFLASTDDATIKLWDMVTGRENTTFKGTIGRVNYLGFSGDGKLLLAVDNGEVGRDATFKSWDLATRRAVDCVGFWDMNKGKGKPSPSLAASWRSQSWRLASRREFQGYSHRSKLDATGLWKNSDTIELRNTATGKRTAVLRGHSGTVRCLAFSTDDKLLASAGYDAVRLWDVGAGKELATLMDESTWVTCIVFNPDSRLLASGSHDGTIRLWDVRAILKAKK